MTSAEGSRGSETRHAASLRGGYRSGSFAGKRDALDLLDQTGFPGCAREQSAKLGALVDVHCNNLKAQLAGRLFAQQDLRPDFPQASLDLHGAVGARLETVVGGAGAAAKAQRLHVDVRLAARGRDRRADLGGWLGAR